MPKVAADNSPLLERAIFGYDGTNYRVVKVDADGNLVAALKAAQTIEVTQDTAADLLATVNIAAAQTIEVTQATAADLNATATLAADQNVQARGYGWIGAAWQRNPLSFGYSGQVAEQVSNLSAAAGTNFLDGTAVPAGEIWEVTNIQISNVNTASTLVQAIVNVDSINMALVEAAAPAAGRWTIWNGSVVLKATDYVRGYFTGCTLNDDLYLRYLGRRIDIDQ